MQEQARITLSEAASLFEDTSDLKYAGRAYRELARMTMPKSVNQKLRFARKALDLYERAGAEAELKAARREFKKVLGRKKEMRPDEED
jgi:hypothetical protein